MRSIFLAVLVACLPATIHADPDRQLVVSLRSALPIASSLRTPTHASAPRFDHRLAGRCDSLRLRLVGFLADDLPAVDAGPPARRPRSRSMHHSAANPFGLDPTRIALLEASDSTAAASAIGVLASDPAIAWIEPNRSREPAVHSLVEATTAGSLPGRSPRDRSRSDRSTSEFPSDPCFRDGRQWGLRNAQAGANGVPADIHALDAWRRSKGGSGVRLAIADTGIDPAHPELNALVAGGMRIELGTSVATERNPSFADSFGHGTPVAGVMAARTNEGPHFDSLGVAGVCGGDGLDNPGCRIVPIKITAGHAGTATSFDIARAILYAADVGARAVNLSFAGASPSRLERLALHEALTRGCVVVAASGNHGDTRPGRLEYPAAYALDGLCIAVGASDAGDRRAAFSSYGPGLDLLAPGVDIWTTFMTYPSAAGVLRNGYVVGSGTSFAAPFVTGTIGLLAAARPELTDSDFRQILRASADPISPADPDEQTGSGRLNAARALEAIAPSFGIWHDEVAADRFVRGPVESLVVLESGPGSMSPRGWPRARRIEASATIAIPDSFLDPVRVWPRVGGTLAVRGDFRLPYFAPWAEVGSLGLEAFTLRGFLYEPDTCDTCEAAEALPLPLDQARFGFTVLGRIDRAPALEVSSPAAGGTVSAGDSLMVSWNAADPDEVTWIDLWLDGGRAPLHLARLRGSASSASARLPCPAPFVGAGALRVVAVDDHGRRRDRTSVTVPIRIASGGCDSMAVAVAVAAPALGATPNPFRRDLRLAGPAGARIEVFDVAGRVVRREWLDGRLGTFLWNGRDQQGRALDPGLYLIRCDGPRGRTQTKVLKLE